MAVPVVAMEEEEQDKKRKMRMFAGGNDMKYVCVHCGKILTADEVTVDPDGDARCDECTQNILVNENAWEFKRYEKPKEEKKHIWNKTQ